MNAPLDPADLAQQLGMLLDCNAALNDRLCRDLRMLGNYIHAKTSAIAARQLGDMDRALQEETRCEAAYKALPKEWRW